MDGIVPLVGGLILLIVGGDLLVRGAVRAAGELGMSPLVIGLTLVAFGTSAPELVTSVQAALSGYSGIAYGNIVGSNIANILLILGISALITPIAVSSGALKRDTAVMVATAVVFAGAAALVPMNRWIGVLFLIALGGYIYLAFRQERAGADSGAVYDKAVAAQIADPALRPPSKAIGNIALPLLLSLAGLAIVVVGGFLLVDGAVDLARSFGVSETIIGLTIVSVGTSMPELVTSVLAAIRKQTDVAFGNLIGSNIYNILAIGGSTALVAPGNVPSEIIGFDNLYMIGASLLVVAMAFSGRRISRPEAGFLLLGYVAYIALIWP